MHTVFALLCFVVVIHWLMFPYPSGLLHWHCGNLTIAPVPAKQPWWIWINTSCEFIMNDCITTTKQSTTKPCAYFLGYTVATADSGQSPGIIHYNLPSLRGFRRMNTNLVMVVGSYIKSSIISDIVFPKLFADGIIVLGFEWWYCQSLADSCNSCSLVSQAVGKMTINQNSTQKHSQVRSMSILGCSVFNFPIECTWINYFLSVDGIFQHIISSNMFYQISKRLIIICHC